MADFFEDLGKKITEVADDFGELVFIIEVEDDGEFGGRGRLLRRALHSSQ